MADKKKFPVTNIGTVTLLMIFIVLCMVTFAVLSLSEAARDRGFSQQLADQTSDYYAACSRAENILAQVDAAISETRSSGASGDAYYAALSERLAGITGAELTTEASAGSAGSADSYGEPVTVSYRVPINDRLLLSVSLEAAGPGSAAGSNYRIVSWEETQAEEWKGDNSITLIQP